MKNGNTAECDTENSLEMNSERVIMLHVMKAEYRHLKQLVIGTLAISGVNFIVLLIMILQLSNEIFG